MLRLSLTLLSSILISNAHSATTLCDPALTPLTPLHSRYVDEEQGKDMDGEWYKPIYLHSHSERSPYLLKWNGRQFEILFEKIQANYAYIAVSSSAGDVYIGRGIQGEFHHSSFFAGEPVAFAGTFTFGPEGQLIGVSNRSGHYRQEGAHGIKTLLLQLQAKRMPLPHIISIEPRTNERAQLLRLVPVQNLKVHHTKAESPEASLLRRALASDYEIIQVRTQGYSYVPMTSQEAEDLFTVLRAAHDFMPTPQQITIIN